MYKKSLLYVGSKNMSNNQFYSLGWNKLILHYKLVAGEGFEPSTFRLLVLCSPLLLVNINLY